MIPGLCADHPNCGFAPSLSATVDSVRSLGALAIRAELSNALADLHRDPLVRSQPGERPTH
jgi:hypothetical protein